MRADISRKVFMQMQLQRILVSFFLIAFCPHPGWSQGTGTAAEDLYTRALEYRKAYQYDSAKTFFRKAIRKSGSNPDYLKSYAAFLENDLFQKEKADRIHRKLKRRQAPEPVISIETYTDSAYFDGHHALGIGRELRSESEKQADKHAAAVWMMARGLEIPWQEWNYETGQVYHMMEAVRCDPDYFYLADAVICGLRNDSGEVAQKKTIQKYFVIIDSSLNAGWEPDYYHLGYLTLKYKDPDRAMGYFWWALSQYPYSPDVASKHAQIVVMFLLRAAFMLDLRRLNPDPALGMVKTVFNMDFQESKSYQDFLLDWNRPGDPFELFVQPCWLWWEKVDWPSGWVRNETRRNLYGALSKIVYLHEDMELLKEHPYWEKIEAIPLRNLFR